MAIDIPPIDTGGTCCTQSCVDGEIANFQGLVNNIINNVNNQVSSQYSDGQVDGDFTSAVNTIVANTSPCFGSGLSGINDGNNAGACPMAVQQNTAHLAIGAIAVGIAVIVLVGIGGEAMRLTTGKTRTS